jgi:uroporphyrinogen-III decarboxylase
MSKETMTPTERILAAINLEPYDRVPVAPHLNAEFPMRLKGRSTADAYHAAHALEAHEATFELYDTAGGWDALTMAAGGGLPFTPEFVSLFAAFYGDVMRFPGNDDRVSEEESSPQYAEHKLLEVEDYDAIAEMGWHNFCLENMGRISSSVFGIPLATTPLEDIAAGATQAYIATRDRWHALGVPVLAGTNPCDPQMILSIMRTLTEFTMDLYQRPEKVKSALEAISNDIIPGAIDSMLLTGPPPETGIPGIMLACERGSGAIYNLEIFEEFVWPYIKRAVEAFWEAGFVTTLHFDSDWTRNMPYLLELPAKSCIVELDSTTDIFKANEILGDHLCIMGDVPPAISALGTVEEMEDYCKKLIDVVGKDTGFILSNGCAVPPDTKLENYKAMINTARTHLPPGAR